jgi:hypothetical protein
MTDWQSGVLWFLGCAGFVWFVKIVERIELLLIRINNQLESLLRRTR